MRTATADIQSLIDRIDHGEIRLPEIQRAYVWKPAQVAGLVDSLYRRYPSGSLLLWETDAPVTEKKVAIDGPGGAPIVKPQYLLDGQQRLTSLHRVFTGHEKALVVFNIEAEKFQIESAATKKDVRWIRVHTLLSGSEKSFALVQRLSERLPHLDPNVIGDRLDRVKKIASYPYFLEILDNLPYSEVTDIFVRVNSRGNPLRATDLALATLSSRWPGVISKFDAEVEFCVMQGYSHLEYTFFTRCLAAIVSDTSSAAVFATATQKDLDEGWRRMHDGLLHLLQLLKQRADIATSALIPSVNALVPLVVFLGERHEQQLSNDDADALLYWLFGAFIQARYSGATSTVLAQDVAAIRSNTPIEALFRNLGLLGQRLVVTDEMLAGRGSTSPFFILSYLAARKEEATDWWHAVPICTDAEGKFSLEYHHIHPRATLVNHYSKAEINDLANLAFISARANKKISSRSPSEYFPEVGDRELERHRVPLAAELRTADKYPEFVRARRALLARVMTTLLDSFRPKSLAEHAAEADDPAAGERLVVAAYGSDPDAPDSVVYMSASADETQWDTALPLADLNRFVEDLENGLAAELVLGGETIAVASGAEVAELPVGPLLVRGTVEEWRKVLDRELADLTAKADAPPLPTPSSWSGSRRAFPVIDSE